VQKLTAVDLFAGGGGLSVGLKRAGFRIAAAIEIEKNAFDTYVANHRDVRSHQRDIRSVSGPELNRLAGGVQIHLLTGCPPCQGFTSLTSKYKKRDRRNSLIDEMLRMIVEVSPTAVMMENVPGLAIRGKWRLDKFLRGLRRLGYLPTTKVLQVADYGVPQFRRRLVVLAGLGFEIPMPEPTHSRDGKNGLPKWRTVREAISGLPRPVRFDELRRNKTPPQKVAWHVVRAISPENEARLRAAKPGKRWWTIPSRLRPSCHKGKYRGFGNVYGRMRWGDVSPTITGGCTTLSKGRFGHPQANRTISIREAALLQTFPKGYVIATSRIDQACSIIGNALPCDFAAVLARQCHRYIKLAKSKKGRSSQKQARRRFE
jgi:DNA (cytosine-5)-methyltransferase 1